MQRLCSCVQNDSWLFLSVSQSSCIFCIPRASDLPRRTHQAIHPLRIPFASRHQALTTCLPLHLDPWHPPPQPSVKMMSSAPARAAQRTVFSLCASVFEMLPTHVHSLITSRSYLSSLVTGEPLVELSFSATCSQCLMGWFLSDFTHLPPIYFILYSSLFLPQPPGQKLTRPLPFSSSNLT